MTVAIQQAIQQAIQATIARLRVFVMGNASQVPIKTGKLRQSVTIDQTTTGLSIKWSAESPKGYDYALIQDIGGPTGTGGYIAGKYYSDVTREYAKQWFHEELIRALEAIKP